MYSACPFIQKNYIEASTHNGIVCEGQKCWPDIKANIIESNRKAGIKLVDYARAHIGGQSIEDLDRERTLNDEFKGHAKLYEEMFDDGLTGEEPEDGNNHGAHGDGMMSYYEILNVAADFKEKVMLHINDSKEKMGNTINQNYSQGILLEEGCSADIFSNLIMKNAKANIALGGEYSG